MSSRRHKSAAASGTLSGQTKWISPPLRPLALPIGTLNPDPDNACDHPEYNLESIAASLRRFGQQKPIVCDRNRIVRAGNGTLAAAIALGHTHIAAVVSDLSPQEIAAYALADNRTGELSDWNEEKLRAALSALPEDLQTAAGWTPDQAKRVIGNDQGVREDDPPEKKRATTVEGDLWILGEHRLLCGSSTKYGDVERLMDGQSADLCATDPPYLVDYTGERGDGRGKDWSDLYREVEIRDAAAFFHALFVNVLQVIKPNTAIYCWHAHKRQGLIAATWERLGILDHQQIVWVKPVPVFGRVFWHFRHEPCMMGWVKGSIPKHDGDQSVNSVWEDRDALEAMTKEQLVKLISDAASIWKIDWQGKARPTANEHPTEKPVEIFARPMRKHTAPGALCFEPFSGSGTQLSAAEQLGRRCFAMELEPVFVEVAVRRWQRLTGKKAVRYGTNGKKKGGIAAD